MFAGQYKCVDGPGFGQPWIIRITIWVYHEYTRYGIYSAISHIHVFFCFASFIVLLKYTPFETCLYTYLYTFCLCAKITCYIFSQSNTCEHTEVLSNF